VSLAPGTRLGSFRIDSLLGEGGMGAVYKAEDERLGRPVALKVVRAGAAADSVIARFRREAQAAAAVEHPNVLRLHEASWSGATAYIVLELAPGGSLQDRIKKSGRLPWREAALIGAQIARGLAAIHAAGLVHRDLKPANVLFDETGTSKITDFGIVRAAEGSLAFSRQLTATGEMLGTPQFMAPEQTDSAKEVGSPADVFSLGGTLHAALTGGPPFEGDGANLIYKIVTSTPDDVRKKAPEVPPALASLVLELFAREPAKRPTAAAVAERLEAIARTEEGAPRSRAPWLVGLAVAIASVALVALLLRGRSPEPVASPPPPTPTKPAPPVPAAPPKPAPTAPSAASLLTEIVNRSPLAHVERVLGSYAWKDSANLSAVLWSGEKIVTADYFGVLRFWNEKGEDARPRFFVGQGQLFAAALAPDGRRLVAGFEDGQSFLCVDIATLATSALAGPGLGHVRELGFIGPTRFVARSEDGRVGIGELDGATFRVTSPDEGATSLGTCPGAATFGVGHADGSIRLSVGDVSRTLVGRGKVHALALSNDARKLAACRVQEGAHELSLVDVSSERSPVVFAKRIEEGVTHTLAAFAESVLVIDRTSGVRLVSASDDKLLGLALGERGDAFHSHVDVSPDGKRAVVGVTNSLSVWDLADRKRLTPAFGHLAPVEALAVSANGKRVLSGGRDAQVLLWDLDHPDRPPASFTGHADFLRSVAISPDGKTGATIDSSGMTRLLDLEAKSSEELPIAAVLEGRMRLAFSPDGTRIVCGHSNGLSERPVHGEASSGNELKDDRDPPQIEGLIWPQEHLVIGSTHKGEIRLWDPPRGAIAGGQNLKDVGMAPLLSVAYAPDAGRIVTGDARGRLLLWSTKSGRTQYVEDVHAFQVHDPHDGEVRGVAFLDEDRIVTASRDWNLSLVDWTKAWNDEPGAVLGKIHVGDEICSFAAGKDPTPFVLVGTYRGTILKLRFDDVK
jgi:serine/threonine protein kinase/WD40 repeat protein